MKSFIACLLPRYSLIEHLLSKEGQHNILAACLLLFCQNNRPVTATCWSTRRDYSSTTFACSATKPCHTHKLRELRDTATQIHLYQLSGPLPDIPTSILNCFNSKDSMHSEVRAPLSIPLSRYHVSE